MQWPFSRSASASQRRLHFAGAKPGITKLLSFCLAQRIVSWRFKALDSGFPFVLITAPADYRLLRYEQQAAQPGFTIRALVFRARAIEEVRYWLGEGPGLPMRPDEQGVWPAGAAGAAPFLPLTVKARDTTGRLGRHQLLPALAAYQLLGRPGAGSDAASIGAWEENGISGTQLSPNRNAKPLTHRPSPTS